LPRVLIADDNKALRDALKTMLLTGDGWEICGEASNGQEAVSLAASSKPDVILLDFQMPVMNGLVAAREIIKRDPSVPIAMYTLHQNPFFESEAKAAGIRRVISKTDLFSSLASTLCELVDSSSSSNADQPPSARSRAARSH
jgi:DNA-binding NarL/FixJ family response regulator